MIKSQKVRSHSRRPKKGKPPVTVKSHKRILGYGKDTGIYVEEPRFIVLKGGKAFAVVRRAADEAGVTSKFFMRMIGSAKLKPKTKSPNRSFSPLKTQPKIYSKKVK